MQTTLATRVHCGQVTTRGALSIAPLFFGLPSARRGYVTGADAVVDVSELPRPRVDRLLLTARGPLPSLLSSGDLWEGGWQHQVLTETLLLPSDQPTPGEVRCTEAGRFSGGTVHQRRVRRVHWNARTIALTALDLEA